MTMTTNQAIDRIRDEMAEKASNPNIQYVGEYLTGYVGTHPGAAAAICTEGKSITGALKALEGYARKLPRSGDCVMVDPETGFREILKYYGVDDQQPVPAQKPRAGRTLDLDTLLGL